MGLEGQTTGEVIDEMGAHAKGDTYIYEAKKPKGVLEWGTKIERSPTARHDIPVNEVFPDKWEDYNALSSKFREWVRSLHMQAPSVNTLSENENMDRNIYVENLSEAFEFESWGQNIRLYNFDKTHLTDDQLGEIANALRAVGQLTGGSVFEHLSRIAILPEDHPGINLWGNYQTSGFAETDEGLIGLSGKLLKKHLLGQMRERLFNKKEAHKRKSMFRPKGIGKGDLANVLVHELHHFIEDESLIEKLDEKAPSRYGERNQNEAYAETGAAMFNGSTTETWVRPKHKEQYRRVLQSVHSGKEGPTFVTCKEIDLQTIKKMPTVA